MSLEIDIQVESRSLDVALTLGEGRSLAVVGPNGSGKSTLLAAIAGLITPDSGHITIAGRPVFDATRSRSHVPTHRRHVSMLAQESLLFPHLTVHDNVAFGLRSQGVSRSEARKAAGDWLEVVDAQQFADRRPHQLSGGQAQRVALARALAPEPKLLLLDEPMAALDADAVPAMRRVLTRVIAERSVIMVTHDILDAVVLTDRTIVLEEGQCVDDGSTDRVLMQPRSDFAASLAGVNLLRGTATGHDSIRSESGAEIIGQPSSGLTLGAPAMAVFSPAAVVLALDQLSTSSRNAMTARIDAIENRAGTCRVHAGGVQADITLAAAAELGLDVGRDVHLMVKAMEITLHPGVPDVV